jgi:hypothetical protein
MRSYMFAEKRYPSFRPGIQEIDRIPHKQASLTEDCRDRNILLQAGSMPEILYFLRLNCPCNTLKNIYYNQLDI